VELRHVDREIATRLRESRSGELLESMPGFGPVLAAAFIARVGADLNDFESADQLASAAGLAPVPKDSGRVTGNNHRPKRFDRILLRTCYLAAHSSLKNSAASRAYYHRKRSEGKSHKQAVIALARRRTNVIWALLRQQAPYREPAMKTI
jgi:transposase